MMKLTVPTNNNLLAFSSGIDSTALFFLLYEQNINFDIAIVNYGLRDNVNEEINYANDLAKKYNKKIYTINFPKENTFSEKSARDFRYEFFEDIIQKYNYESLITGHQLNDKLEWFLMQLAKGAGVVELVGMHKVEIRDDIYYLKPILDIPKQDLLDYLHKYGIKYYIDESNIDEKYKRNFIRSNISNFMIENFSKGIKRSFEYIQKDIDSLVHIKILKQHKDYYELENMQDELVNIRAIDKIAKRLGVLMSSRQREEVTNKQDVVISHKLAVVITNKIIYISPYIKKTMTKKQKEHFRKDKIPPKVRGYLSSI